MQTFCDQVVILNDDLHKPAHVMAVTAEIHGNIWTLDLEIADSDLHDMPKSLKSSPF
jgi:hypothetical protein